MGSKDKLVKSLHYNTNASLPVCECQLGASSEKLWGKKASGGGVGGEAGREGAKKN